MKIFYDVDTQNDFMLSTGRLYVPGAEDIIGKIAVLTDYARRNEIPIFGSLDAHTESDPEFKVFPTHCVNGTSGQEKVLPPRFGETFFNKQHYDVFTNSYVEKVLKKNEVREAVVYGVATDICVKAAVLGMQQRNIQCYVVEDAIRGVFPDKTKQALEEMVQAGAKFVTTQDIVGGRT